jgi:hypothetical protein
MSYKKISHYMIFAFLGGLGLFNSTQLESRYATDTNQELIFQNGQIISSAIIIVGEPESLLLSLIKKFLDGCRRKRMVISF